MATLYDLPHVWSSRDRTILVLIVSDWFLLVPLRIFLLRFEAKQEESTELISLPKIDVPLKAGNFRKNTLDTLVSIMVNHKSTTVNILGDIKR